MNKVGIFIDYDNVYDTIDKKYNNDGKIDVQIKFFENLWEKYKSDHVVKFIAFADFTKINKDNLITELQKRSIKLEHCYSNGAKEEYRKNASDLALCISVIKSIYEMDIDTYVLVSSDCDMIPILNELKFKNKNTIHIFSPTSANKDIKEYAKDKKWAVVSDFHSIESILGVEVYEDKVSEIPEDDFVKVVKSSMPFIISNIIDQRGKKNEYGFGYLTTDIMKGTGVVKEDAKKLATRIKDSEIVLPLEKPITDSNGKEFQNFRLNAEHPLVIEIFGKEINNEDKKDVFIKKVVSTLDK
jgi:uncharacterized LabA/DUF88 family protein